MFTHIENIEQIIKHFDSRKEFTIGVRDDFTVIDYNYILPDTFDDPIRLEGRGIKFCSKTGAILARPFHKFFNLGEKLHTQFDQLPWHHPFVVQEKYDGSMIHPALLGDQLVLMTRKGISDVAVQAAKECLTPELEQQMREWLQLGYTPMFEYTSPNNRIVIEYSQPALKFLAMRNTVTGVYNSRTHMFDGFLGSNIDPKNLVDSTKASQGREGVVIVWPYTGHRVKLKADEYVKLHRAVDTLSSEKRILDVVLDGQADDLCSMISLDRAEKIREYEASVNECICRIQEKIENYVKENASLSQKDFALKTINNNDFKPYSSEIFAVRAGKLENYQAGQSFIRRHSKSQADLEINRKLLGIKKIGSLAFNHGED